MSHKRRIDGPNGPTDAIEVGFRPAGEHWNEYLLDDGTILRAKMVVTAVERVEGVYDEVTGNPTYFVQSTPVLAVSPPEELRKPKS